MAQLEKCILTLRNIAMVLYMSAIGYLGIVFVGVAVRWNPYFSLKGYGVVMMSTSGVLILSLFDVAALIWSVLGLIDQRRMVKTTTINNVKLRDAHGVPTKAMQKNKIIMSVRKASTWMLKTELCTDSSHRIVSIGFSRILLSHRMVNRYPGRFNHYARYRMFVSNCYHVPSPALSPSFFSQRRCIACQDI